MNGKFKFHGVGQGLFYSGILSEKGCQPFSLVYDCGSFSEQHLLEEIGEFKNLLKNDQGKNKNLDLLVISHLHADHINGIEELLQGVTVGTVVMPYMTDDLLLMAKLSIRKDTPPKKRKFLCEFYKNPGLHLLSMGVGKVVQIGRPNGNGKEREGATERGTETNPFSFSRDSAIKRATNVEKWSVKTHEKIVWEFIFENLNISKSIVDTFRKKARKFFPDVKDALDVNCDLRELNREITEEELKKYKNVINRTSIMMYHTPVGGTSHFVNYYDRGCCCRFRPCRCRVAGSLLTGDIDIRESDKTFLVDELAKEPPYPIAIMQIPHHGGKMSCSKKLTSLKRACCAVSFGITNGYGHPNGDLIREFILSEHQVVEVTEDSGFFYHVYR